MHGERQDLAPVEISLQEGPRQGTSQGTSQRWRCKIRRSKLCRPSRNITPPIDNQLEEDGVGLKALEGYFDNLAAAAVNKKGVLQ